ncbi:MAG: hypothetical protein ACHQ1H_05210 [Nitrososphaerales archaeon]
MNDSVLLPILQVANTSEFDIADLLSLGSGIFAAVLLSLSLFSWSRRKQRSVLLVSVVFALFLVKVAVGAILPFSDTLDAISKILDFVILALLFLAIAVPPRMRRLEKPSTSRN